MRKLVWGGMCLLLASLGAPAVVQPADNAGPSPIGPFAAAGKSDAQDKPRRQATSSIWRGLEYQMDTRDFQQALPLEELCIIVYNKLDSDGVDMPIVVNKEAFRQFADGDEILDRTPIKLPPVPSKMKVATLLRDALAQLPGVNATYLVRDDRVEITTQDRASVQWLLGESVAARYQNTPAADVLSALGAQVGCTIVIDKRAVTEAGKQVTVTFRGDATLATALRSVTDMVALKVIVLDGSLYVTTPSHAGELRKAAPAAVHGEDPLWPDWRRLPRHGSGKKQDGEK